MKVLFWVPYPTEGPSNRFRVEQYLPYLREKGISYCLRPFWNREAYKILFENGYYLKKIYYFLKGSIARFKDLIRLSEYDLIFVHREAYPVGAAFLEKLASRKKPIIYDFDDSIFLPTHSSANKLMRLLKNPRKTNQILKLSRTVIAGNNYLKQYALKFNKNVTIIPTPLDTDRYLPNKQKRNSNTTVIGWIGTYTTNKYLNLLKDVFAKLMGKYTGRLEIKFVGCRDNLLNTPGIIYKNWSLKEEVRDLQDFDVGIMPVWDDDWARGKCAFKIIQYMAVGASVVASPVGMNKEVISNGENGFLAFNEEDWLKKLSLLIENASLRERFARAGRQRVQSEYAVKNTAPKFIQILEKTYELRKH